jgi:ubiquinol-cytochrome c reductase cytochrome c1 subunit
VIKRLIATFALGLACLAGGAARADETGYRLEQAPSRINDPAALRNGAKLFADHCLNCHGAMRPEDARRWLGTAPPDLFLMARAKSADYIYTYLRSFYRDASQPTGWNNLVFPNVGMPHVLWERQGPRELTTVAMRETSAGSGGQPGWERVITTYDADGFATVKTEPMPGYRGRASFEARFKPLAPARDAAYDRDVADLTAYLAWMADSTRQERRRLGAWVLPFLALFLVVAWRLNAAYWKYVR